jgi:hypothetical protein
VQEAPGTLPAHASAALVVETRDNILYVVLGIGDNVTDILSPPRVTRQSGVGGPAALTLQDDNDPDTPAFSTVVDDCVLRCMFISSMLSWTGATWPVTSMLMLTICPEITMFLRITLPSPVRPTARTPNCSGVEAVKVTTLPAGTFFKLDMIAAAVLDSPVTFIEVAVAEPIVWIASTVPVWL